MAGVVAGLLGYALSHIIVRFRHLALIMLTLGFGLLLHEAANSASMLTGGADGLQGFRVPARGRFQVRHVRQDGLRLLAGGAVRCFLVSRRIIHSPFGLALRGIRENAPRMPAIGAPSQSHLRKAYTLSAVLAGIAGALLTHTTSTVSLDVLSFGRSADVLVILILGGAGRLYGGILGAIIYMVARDQFSGVNPQYWYFWIGLLLVAVVMFLPNGLLGGASKILKANKLNKRFGSLVVAQDIDLSLPKGARYALIGPNGAGKTTLINLLTGMLRPDSGQIVLGEATAPPTSRRSSRTAACSAASRARFRSTRCFRS